jgi:hypothetical protein
MILSVSGACVTGLVFQHIIDLIGTSSLISPVSTLPSCRLFTTGVPSGSNPGGRSRRTYRDVPYRELQRSAADMAPGTDQGGQAGHGTYRLTTAVGSFQRYA